MKILKLKVKLMKHIIKLVKKLGGTIPENLPTPDKSLKELERQKSNYLIKKVI